MASKYDDLSWQYKMNAIHNYVLNLKSVNKSDWVDKLDLEVIVSLALQGCIIDIGEEVCLGVRETYLPIIKELVENGELEYRVKIHAD